MKQESSYWGSSSFWFVLNFRLLVMPLQQTVIWEWFSASVPPPGPPPVLPPPPPPRMLQRTSRRLKRSELQGNLWPVITVQIIRNNMKQGALRHQGQWGGQQTEQAGSHTWTRVATRRDTGRPKRLVEEMRFIFVYKHNLPSSEIRCRPWYNSLRRDGLRFRDIRPVGQGATLRVAIQDRQGRLVAMTGTHVVVEWPELEEWRPRGEEEE